MLCMAGNIATKQTIAKIQLWDDKSIANKEYLVDKFMDKFDYNLATVQCEDNFHMYKSKAPYLIHFFSNKFVVPTFVLREYTKFQFFLVYYLIEYLLTLLYFHQTFDVRLVTIRGDGMILQNWHKQRKYIESSRSL